MTDSQPENYGYTFCDNCNQVPFCGLKFQREGEIVTRLEPWPGYPASPPCSKGYATLQRLYHPDRMLYPLQRTRPKGSEDPGFKRISWDEAYDTIVRKLGEIKNRFSPHHVFFYVGDPKEPRAPVQRLAAAFGSVNYGSEASTACRRAALLAEILTFGFGTMGNLPSPETRSVLIWGTNPAYSGQPYMCHGELLAAKNRGVKFIVVDPLKTPTATTLADIHLQPRPATTAALAAGFIHVIFRENLHDQDFCSRWIHGLEALRDHVAEFTPEVVERITRVPAKKLIEAAKLFAAHSPGTFMTGAHGTTHNLNAVNNHRALLLIPAICGYIDIPGGVFKPTHNLKGMPSPWAEGPPSFCLRKTFQEKKTHRLDLEEYPLWADLFFEVQTSHLVEWAREGKIKAMLAWGLNTMIWPQTDQYSEAIGQLDFSMAVDYFYRSRSHRDIDILLPAAMNFERLAPFAVFGHRLYGRTPVKPLGECREDWQIALEIGARLVDSNLFFDGSVEKAMDHILNWWGLCYNDLIDNIESGVEVKSAGPELYRKYETGQLRRDGQSGFATPSGKIEATSALMSKYGYPALPEFREPISTSEDYPLILISGARTPFITHSKTRDDSPWLLELRKHPLVTIHPKDAADRNIRRGDRVQLSSPHGAIDVIANPSAAILEGVVAVMHGWSQANVNNLIPRQFDPVSGFPPYKEVTCQVVKLQVSDETGEVG